MFGFNRYDLRLTFNLFSMSVRDRYLGSTLGSFWAFANPLIMLGVYTFVFGFVFKVRLPGAETTLGYVVWLISGYGPWLATVEALMSSTTSVIGAAGVVKNLVFKTELLPISGAFVGLIPLCVSLTFLLILMVVEGNLPDWSVIWVPLIVCVHFFFIVSIGLWLSAVNVFMRDLAMVLPNLLMVIMFFTPIFYPIESMPSLVENLSFLNPFYQIADAYRKTILEHVSPSFLGLTLVAVIAFFLFKTGLAAFRRVKGSFDSAL